MIYLEYILNDVNNLNLIMPDIIEDTIFKTVEDLHNYMIEIKVSIGYSFSKDYDDISIKNIINKFCCGS